MITAEKQQQLPVIKGMIAARQVDGRLVHITWACEVQEMEGSIEEVAAAVFEVELHGNSSGKARIHLFLE